MMKTYSVKKLVTAALAAVMTVCALTGSASAALGDIKVNCVGVTKAPVQDGKVTKEEYGGNDPIVLDGSGKFTEGTWAGTSWKTEVIKYYYTWDAKNLYVGVTVEGDTTEAQEKAPAPGSGECPFGKCDSVQIGFNPGGIIKGTELLMYCVGFNAGGQAVVHGDAYCSEKDGSQTVDVSDRIKAYSRKYSASGINYETEVAIPWSAIFVKGACRTSGGAKIFDMTGEKAKDGYVLPIFCVYTDNDNKGGNVYIRTDATTGNKWVGEEMASIALVLKDAPKPAAAAPAASAKTADAASLALCAAALAGFGMIVLKKKER